MSRFHISQFFQPAIRAILINELIRMKLGPKILRTCLLHWLRVYALKFILDLRYQWFCFYIFCCSFSEEKMCYRKKYLVQDLILPPSIYIHMCNLSHIPIHIRQDWIHLDSLVHPDVSSRPLGSRPSSLQCVGVRAYTHTYTRIHSHPH